MRIPRLLAAAIVAGSVSVSAMGNELQTPEERLSYTIGMDVANMMADQGLDIDLDVFFAGFRAQFLGEETLLTQEEADAERTAYIQRRQQELEAERGQEAARNLEAGQAFLAENRSRDGVTETASGLQYRVIEEGQGRSPQATDRVTVHYRGTLIDGTEFDSSYARGEPATFPLNGVIPGWTEGVQLMSEGATFEFFIPADLAYGSQGRPGPIGPNSTLIFQVELIEVHGD
ncbi:MAG: FKBP-type peptidyl-prolyl cis-trans isomerase [Wenzhouxiangella sp.]